MMTPPPTTIRSRQVCMTERDWHAFGDALQQMFPQARYYLRIGRNIKTEVPPPLIFHRHLRAMPVTYRDEVVMVFDPFWKPSFFKFYDLKEVRPDDWQWVLMPPPHPTVNFRLHINVWTRQGPPHHGVGEIDFYATPKNREHASLMGRFYRLFGKFATNRGLAWVRYPDYLTTPVEKGLDCWCGYDAIEWTRGDARRFLHFNGLSGLRPVDATAQIIPLGRATADE